VVYSCRVNSPSHNPSGRGFKPHRLTSENSKEKDHSSKSVHEFVQARRDIGEKYKNLTPEAERARIYERNLREYRDRLGPSIEYLRDVRKKSWEQIIESAKRTSGRDLGYKGNQ